MERVPTPSGTAHLLDILGQDVVNNPRERISPLDAGLPLAETGAAT